jgi:Tfp pilus assembly protein PilW
LSTRGLPQQARAIHGPVSPQAAFTLVELLVGMSLALMVMTAVLTTYVMIGRNFTRSLGISSANQPTLVSQARRTLAYLAQDVQMASGLSGTPSATNLTLYIPTGTGSKTVSYYLNTSTTNPGPVTVTLSGYSTIVPAQTLVRVDGVSGVMLILQSSLYAAGANGFSCYDSSGNTFSTSDLSAGNYLGGIKYISLSLFTQAGSATNGTLTQVYETDSPRLLLRNKGFLP